MFDGIYGLRKEKDLMRRCCMLRQALLPKYATHESYTKRREFYRYIHVYYMYTR